MPARGIPLLVVLACIGVACVTAGPRREARDRTRLTRQEIMSVDAPTLYDVVLRLRPRWIEADRRAGRGEFGVGRGVVVYQGQTYLGGIAMLRQLKPSMAHELRWLDGPTASATLPTLHGGRVAGAIVVHVNPGR